MRVLVTGGGGFVGGAVARLLQRCGHQVRSLSRTPYPGLEADGVEVLVGDLRDLEAVRAACRGQEGVVHCAALVGIWGDYKSFFEVNVAGTHHIIRACQESGVPRLVFTSSPSVVFSGSDIEGWTESAPYPQDFDSHYSRTKAVAERLVLAANRPDLLTVALRPHLVWGPGEDRLVARMVARAHAGELRRIGSYNKLVDATFIDDAAEAHRLALESLQPGSAAAGRPYFISGGRPLPIWEIINAILEAAGLPPVDKSVSPIAARAAAWAYEIWYAATRRRGEPRLTRFLVQQLSTAHWFDISAARRDLGYEPRVAFADGIERMRKWYESRKG